MHIISDHASYPALGKDSLLWETNGKKKFLGVLTHALLVSDTGGQSDTAEQMVQ